MIIECPACGKRISSKYKTCPHCGARVGDSGEGTPHEDVSRRLAMQRRYRLQAQMYASILLTLIGCVWAWASTDGLEQPPGTWPLATLAAGAAWYIGVRLYMIISRLRGK